MSIAFGAVTGSVALPLSFVTSQPVMAVSSGLVQLSVTSPSPYAATIESLPMAFALVKEMQAEGLEWRATLPDT